jgi:hypothetical protein
MKQKFKIDSNFRIVSGGQTGADVAGLDWALEHRVAHGGWCPKGRKTEEGPLPLKYELTETPSEGYLQRTEWNVRDSDATLIFTLMDTIDGGSRRTAVFAGKHGKPHLHMRPGVHPECISKFLHENKVRILNIAGKRESAAPGIWQFVKDTLDAVLVQAD